MDKKFLEKHYNAEDNTFTFTEFEITDLLETMFRAGWGNGQDCQDIPLALEKFMGLYIPGIVEIWKYRYISIDDIPDVFKRFIDDLKDNDEAKS
jgi:hypothetical protein